MPTTFPQANPTLSKVGLRLNLAGTGILSPILSGLAATVSLTLREGEELQYWRIFSGDGDNPDFENVLPAATDGSTISTTIVMGVDTDSGTSEAKRNYLEWITNYGRSIQQFWVIDLPSSSSIYLAGQEAQTGEAFFQIGSGEPITFGINILPNLTDEFFRVYEHPVNRWCNTLRSWGGAFTAEVFLNITPIISERYVGDIHGYYWSAPPEGIATVTVRLRSTAGSASFVDVTGNLRVEYV
jgi:hypothetical protein